MFLVDYSDGCAPEGKFSVHVFVGCTLFVCLFNFLGAPNVLGVRCCQFWCTVMLV